MTSRIAFLGLCLALAAPLASAPARAGDVSMVSTGHGVLATVSGELVLADIEKLEAIADTGQLNGIVLAGPGGQLWAGYRIGLAARRLAIPTYVPRGVRCVSACAMAWLGGVPRSVQSGAAIGFHHPFDITTRKLVPISVQDVAYLAAVGIPPAALGFMFAHDADSLGWLTPDVAKRYGIQLSELP